MCWMHWLGTQPFLYLIYSVPSRISTGSTKKRMWKLLSSLFEAKSSDHKIASRLSILVDRQGRCSWSLTYYVWSQTIVQYSTAQHQIDASSCKSLYVFYVEPVLALTENLQRTCSILQHLAASCASLAQPVRTLFFIFLN